jgi:hypothetical protein
VPSEPSPSMPSPPSPSPSTSPPSPSTLLSLMMRREYFFPGAEGSIGSFVVHLSLPWCDLYVIMSFVSSWIGRCYSSYIMLLPCFIIVISGDTLYHDVKDDSVRIMCVSLVSVSMIYWCLLEPSSTLKVIVWGNLIWGNANFEECFVALRMVSVRYPLENNLE